MTTRAESIHTHVYVMVNVITGYCAQSRVIVVNVIKLTKFITFPGKCVESPTILINLNNNSRIC